jgi:hypothetical protein
MTHPVWNPGAGGPMAAQQLPPLPSTVLSDGSVRGQRSVASEGPCRTEVGGAGGEPDGRSVPIYRMCWD